MEMQQTHRCFVAFDKGKELRVSGWIARRRMRAGALHLCGQKCLHQLVDQFIARTLAIESQAERATSGEAKPAAPARGVDGSLTSLPARLVANGLSADDHLPGDARGKRVELTMPQSSDMPIAVERERVGTVARAWGSAAWLRERERQQREADAGKVHRRSIA